MTRPTLSSIDPRAAPYQRVADRISSVSLSRDDQPIEGASLRGLAALVAEYSGDVVIEHRVNGRGTLPLALCRRITVLG